MDDNDVTAHVLAIAESGELLRMCAWCERLEINGDWLRAAHALALIDQRNTLSHSICPSCVAGGATVMRPVGEHGH